ncbi:hypothetical protein [Nisaea sp.]|uniref:hypothetical protein n=1 Tax=Nisaea sp. TaxID=2024842 RepID=UPI0032EE6B26
MSAPDNPDDKKDLNKTSNASQPETPTPEKKDAEASAEKKPAAAKKKPNPELSATKDPADKLAEEKPGSPRQGTPWGKRAALSIAAVIAVILLGGPALFALCLSETSRPFDAAIAPNGGPIACPAIARHFEDCYLTEEVTVSAPAAAPKTGLEKFCCDVVVERSLLITARYEDASGSLPRTLSADGSMLPLHDGARLTGSPILLRAGEIPQRSLNLSARPEFSVPLLEQAEMLLGHETGISIAGLIAAIAPNAAEEHQLDRDIPLSEGGTMVRISTGAPEFQQISIRTRTSGTLLFSDILPAGMNPARILGAMPQDTNGLLMRKIDAAGPSARASIRGAFDNLQSHMVSRLETSEEAVSAQQVAGRSCIAFYGAMRQDFSRYDAAVATYIAAGPSGLLTARSPADPHGCFDPGAERYSAELAADWQALDAPMVDLAMAPESEMKADTGPDAAHQETVRKLLLDFASAAKSGARLQDIKAAINDPVAIRFHRKGEAATGSRDSVLRMLHQQWTHVGCWIYAPAGNAGGTAMLLAEAQYPYLNRIVLGFDNNGLVEKVEVTGVTFDDILRFKAANRGRNCQDFLNSVRLAEYRDWYVDNPAGTPTPTDHAERLFHEGLKRKFRLN